VTDSTARYFDALAEAQTALIDAARNAGAGQIAFSERLLDEAQTAQKRSLELVRRVAEQPADIAGNLTAVIEATGDAQSQAFGLTRLFMEGVPDARAQARTQLERIAKANQEVMRTAIAAVRDLYAENPWYSFVPAAGATPGQ
jgi:hypothetical protein